MLEGGFWTAAQVYGGQETRAVENLERQHYEVFCPRIVEQVVNRGKVSDVAKPAFPGYVFIGIESEMTWGPINSTFGVLRLLTRRVGDTWLPDEIPARVIESLRSCEIEDPRRRRVLEPGTVVRALSGPFKDHTAVVLQSAAERIKLMFTFFNRHTEVWFARGDVEPEEV